MEKQEIRLSKYVVVEKTGKHLSSNFLVHALISLHTTSMQKYALVSVSDKSGVVDFARALVDNYGYEVLSTGGTARLLESSGVKVTEVSEHTGFPEMLDGRLKTLHPKIHGGILALREDEEHRKQAQKYDISFIDLVVVNLYPFEQTISRRDCAFEDAIENIDIGGPTMLRAAAKNHKYVTVVCDPIDYSKVLKAMKENGLFAFRPKLALKVFAHTAKYDKAIAEYLASQNDVPNLENISGFPQAFNISLKKKAQLRYGENPHQQAALYGNFLDSFEQLQGKELSYNNILDISAAAYLIGEFEKPSLAIIKHTNPCGVASGSSLEEAWGYAYATDKKSPFGGVIIVNRTLDISLAEIFASMFCELIIAPAYTEKAREILSSKKNVRVMLGKDIRGAEILQDVRSVVGGMLVQDRDFKPINPAKFQVVTKRQPTAEEWGSLLFAWRVVRHVKSNAIVYAKGEKTLGIGAGQMSRVDASEIAVRKADESCLSLRGSIIASDGFFPFPDALETAAKAGAIAAIQPGGSKGDDSVIEVANKYGLAMVFTHQRHFRH